MIKRVAVKTAYANIYCEPKFTSHMVTQALFFEELEVVAEHANWYEVNQWDGYTGYVHKFYISDDYTLDSSNQIFISDRFEYLYKSSDFDEHPAMIVPFGTVIPAEENNGGFNTKQINGNRYFFEHPENNEIVNKREKIILNAKKLLGSPYLWGGKTPFGYDCSGFIQSVVSSVGLQVKRDTSDQIIESTMFDIDFKEIEKGDILFFNIDSENVDHVGIWCGEDDDVIHCGGELKIQSIYDNSSIRLYDHILKVRSLFGKSDAE